MVWRGRVNALLRTTTGYELTKPGRGRPAQRPQGRKGRRGKYVLRSDYDDAAKETIMAVRRRTMTSSEKLFGLISAVRYVVEARHPRRHRRVRRLARRVGRRDDPHAPGARDHRPRHLPLRHLRGDDRSRPSTTSAPRRPALEDWKQAQAKGEHPWGEVFGPESLSLEGVREAVLATGYPADRLHFVKGPVEETIPAQAPGDLAMLRLDTDWYESTRHELEHLYPAWPRAASSSSTTTAAGKARGERSTSFSKSHASDSSSCGSIAAGSQSSPSSHVRAEAIP